MPGYRDAHVYPTDPQPSQGARARQRRAAERPCSTPATYPHARSRRRSSRPISPRSGYASEIKTFPSRQHVRALGKPGAPFDLAWSGWVADYPDPDGDAELDPRRQLRRPRPSTIRPTSASSPPPRSYPARSATSPTASSTSISPATPRRWSRSATCSTHDFFSARIGCQTDGYLRHGPRRTLPQTRPQHVRKTQVLRPIVGYRHTPAGHPAGRGPRQ